MLVLSSVALGQHAIPLENMLFCPERKKDDAIANPTDHPTPTPYSSPSPPPLSRLTSKNPLPRPKANRITKPPQKQGFVQVYTRILLAGAAPNGPFAQILRHLASPTAPPAPILIHCTAGKDRTGVIVALILSLCGVSDDAVAHEYSLTDLGLGERKEEFISHLIAVDPLKGDRAAAERMVSSRAESMRGTLRMVKERWGGVEGYVRQVGLSAEEVEAIRGNLVVEVVDGLEVLKWEEHAKLML